MLDTGAIRPSQSPWCNTRVSAEKGQNPVLLHRFLLAQCMNEEGLLSTATDTGDVGDYGRICPLLNNGFQKQVLAGEDGARIPTVYRLYSG